MVIRSRSVLERRSVGVLAVGLVLGGIVGALVAARQPVVYRATSAVFVSNSSGGEFAGGAHVGERPPSPGIVGGADVRRSYAEIVTTPFLLERVIERLDLGTTAEALARRVHVDEPEGSALLEIDVDDADRAAAVRVADAVAAESTVVSAELTPSASGDQVHLTVVHRAAGFVRTVLPDVPFDLGAGSLLGLLTASLVVLVRHRTGVARWWARISPEREGAPSVGRAPSMFR